MNGASDQPEEFGVQPEQGRQEEPQSNADSTSDATASPEDSTSSAPHSRRVRRRISLNTCDPWCHIFGLTQNRIIKFC